MMNGKKGNKLIVIEDKQIKSYTLDNRNTWEIGRASKDNIPDIKLKSLTVSRKHGKFQNMEGIWFYLDYKGKNGTVYNKKHINTGINGRVKPILLNDGDVFVFGGEEEEVIDCKTIWALFITRDYEESWRIVDTKECKRIKIVTGEATTILNRPNKGTVIDKEDGIAIYMGELTYLIGNIKIFCY